MHSSRSGLSLCDRSDLECPDFQRQESNWVSWICDWSSVLVYGLSWFSIPFKLVVQHGLFVLVSTQRKFLVLAWELNVNSVVSIHVLPSHEILAVLKHLNESFLLLLMIELVGKWQLWRSRGLSECCWVRWRQHNKRCNIVVVLLYSVIIGLVIFPDDPVSKFGGDSNSICVCLVKGFSNTSSIID